MRTAAVLFALAAVAIVGAWAWLGAPITMPVSLLAPGEKLNCVSYAPFRGAQDPFGPDVPIDARQIDEDLAQLKPYTDCIRTYSIDHGLDQIPEIARRHGMKMMLGLWLSSVADSNSKQISTAIDLARRYSDVVTSVVVGNEVLLRGEMSAPDLVRTIREVKAQVPVPVTYADVWEFWLRYREVADAVDFITIHILPYWEDLPIPVGQAAPHVLSIRSRVMAAFPGKEIFLGEFGWPSAGRMREGALPSPANEARAIEQVLGLAKRDGFRVNVIEAYDQPWKRVLEGTVGGHWGLFDAYQRKAKFILGAPVSNHPGWRWQAGGGVGLALLTFGAAYFTRREGLPAPTRQWVGVAVAALVSGTLIGWTIENIPIESLRAVDWVRTIAWAAVAMAAPVIGAATAMAGVPVPSFARVLAHGGEREREPLALVLGIVAILLVVLAVQAALGLVFDPRYRDFPFAPLTGAVVPLVAFRRTWPRRKDLRVSAETVAAATLALAAVYILGNETFANWQAAWFSAGLIGLSIALLPERVAPG